MEKVACEHVTGACLLTQPVLYLYEGAFVLLLLQSQPTEDLLAKVYFQSCVIDINDAAVADSHTTSMFIPGSILFMPG